MEGDQLKQSNEITASGRARKYAPQLVVFSIFSAILMLWPGLLIYGMGMAIGNISFYTTAVITPKYGTMTFWEKLLAHAVGGVIFVAGFAWLFLILR